MELHVPVCTETIYKEKIIFDEYWKEGSVTNLRVIGARLSEPHTSMTPLRTRVCNYASLLAWTNHLSKILNKRV